MSFGTPVSLRRWDTTANKIARLNANDTDANNVLAMNQIRAGEFHLASGGGGSPIYDGATGAVAVATLRDSGAHNFGLSGAAITFDGDVVVSGDLMLTGQTLTVNGEVSLTDSHVYMNAGYQTAAGRAGGLAVNYLPTATVDTANGAVAATTLATTGTGIFAAGDFVQIASSDNGIDGVYEVVSHTANVLTINGTPTHQFCATAMAVGTEDTGTKLTKVTVSVLQAGTDGLWEMGKGATASDLTSDLEDLGAAALTGILEDLDTLGAAASDGQFIVATGAGAFAYESGATVRTSLGLAIGSDVQAYDAELAALAGLTSAADGLPYFTGSGTAALATMTAAGRAILDDADASAQRTTLGLAIGSDVQAYDAELAALAGLTSAADSLPYFTGSGTAALATMTAAGRAILDDANASAQRTTLGLAIGSDVQAYDADLAAIAALANTDGNFMVGNGSAWVAESGATARTSLGLGTGDSPTFANATLTTDLTVATITGQASSVVIGAASDMVSIGSYGGGNTLTMYGSTVSISGDDGAVDTIGAGLNFTGGMGGAYSATSAAGGGGFNFNTGSGGAGGGSGLDGAAGGDVYFTLGGGGSNIGFTGGKGGSFNVSGGQGGDAENGGDVTFDAGMAGSGGSDGAISIGASYALTLALANSATTTSAYGLWDFANTGGSTGNADFDVAGYAQFAGAVEFDSTVQLDGAATFNADATFADAVKVQFGTGTDADIAWVDGSSLLDFNVTGSLEIDTSAAIAIESSGGAISIGADAVAQAINIGTAGARTVKLGNTAATVEIDGPVVQQIDEGWGVKTGAGGLDVATNTVGTGAVVYFSGNDTLSGATAASSGGAEDTFGVYDGTTIVDRGPVTIAKKTGAAWTAGDKVYLDPTNSEATTTAPSGSSEWVRSLGRVMTSAASGDATGRVWLTLSEDPMQNPA
jgi:hypothetical protein